MGGATSTTLRFYRLALGHNSGSINAVRLFFGACDRSRWEERRGDVKVMPTCLKSSRWAFSC